jgi:hypothetical protein
LPPPERLATLVASFRRESRRVPPDPNQQPIKRTVGRRIARADRPPTAGDRAALDSMARYRTRAPKGVFIYYSAEEMDRDRLSWTVDAIVERQR